MTNPPSTASLAQLRDGTATDRSYGAPWVTLNALAADLDAVLMEIDFDHVTWRNPDGDNFGPEAGVIALGKGKRTVARARMTDGHADARLRLTD